MDVLSSLHSGLLPCLLVQFPCAGSGIITYSFSRLVYSSDVASMSPADGRSMSIFTEVVLRWGFSCFFVSLAKDFMDWLLSSCLSLSSDCICSHTMLDAPRTRFCRRSCTGACDGLVASVSSLPLFKSNQIKKSFIASCLHNFWAKIHNIPKEIEHLKYYTVL